VLFLLQLQIAPRKQTGFKKSYRGGQIRREDGIARGIVRAMVLRIDNINEDITSLLLTLRGAVDVTND